MKCVTAEAVCANLDPFKGITHVKGVRQGVEGLLKLNEWGV